MRECAQCQCCGMAQSPLMDVTRSVNLAHGWVGQRGREKRVCQCQTHGVSAMGRRRNEGKQPISHLPDNFTTPTEQRLGLALGRWRHPGTEVGGRAAGAPSPPGTTTES